MEENSDALVFRDATIEDLPLITEIYNSTVESRLVTADTEKVSVESKTEWFYQHTPHKRPLLIIQNKSGKTVGWLSFQSFYGRPAYDATAEISLYLHADFRSKGLGKKVLFYAIEKAKTLHIHNLLGIIFSHNLASVALFRQFEFEEWGFLPDVAVMDDKPYSVTILGKKID